MPIIEEVLLEAALDGLVQAILIAKEKATFFKKTLKRLESTLESVGPIVKQVNKSENGPTGTLSRLVEQLKKAKVLVDMYSDISKWKFLEKRKVKKLIQEMDESLQLFLSRDFLVQQLVCLTSIDKDMTEMNKKMDELNKKMDHIIALSRGESDFEMPEPATKKTFPSPENNENDGKQSSPFFFELLWETRKGTCLNIRAWRHVRDA